MPLRALKSRFYPSQGWRFQENKLIKHLPTQKGFSKCASSQQPLELARTAN